MKNTLYPLTIILDRYTGAYSGGKYTAWNLHPNEVPFEVSSNDIDAFEFWESNKIIVGVGDTIKAAVKDLIIKIKS